MKRRDFIQNTALLSTAISLGFSQTAFSKAQKYKLGLQLFSVRDVMDKDPIDTLKALKKMGYQDFETYGYNSKEGTLYGLKTLDLKQRLDDLGLTVTSGHYGFSDYFDASESKLNRFVDRCIQGAKDLDSSYITWPWIDPIYRNAEGFKKLADKLNSIAEQVVKAGLGFAYHNHGYEFEQWNGTTGHNILMERTDPSLVKLQMDMYWVIHSGKTPKELVAAQPGRYVMWHIKDMDIETRDYTELGNGSIDYTKILPSAYTSGLEYLYIEQGGNFAHSSMQSAEDSAKYYKKYLSHLL